MHAPAAHVYEFPMLWRDTVFPIESKTAWIWLCENHIHAVFLIFRLKSE